nr:macrophage mannose receptor 1-like [Misgurnus anguillicaudatus]
MAETLYFGLLLIALCSISECIQHRYHYIDMNKTWTEAQSYCREKYTDLATVDNMNDMKQLKKSVNNQMHVWIGLNNTGVYKWKWSMGDPVNHTNLVINSSINGDGNCVFMRNGTWCRQNCDQKLTFICYNGDKRLFYETSNKMWNDSQIFCREHHTDLVSVRNQSENEQIQQIINDSHISVWIGLFSDSWEWSDQSNSTFRYWKSKEPSGEVHPACVEVRMENQGQWNDAACNWSHTFVCHEDKLVLINKSLSWSDALSYCRQNHVDLVSVDSEKIQRWVSELVKQASTRAVWMGLRHSCSVGLWFWVNGEMVCYQNWAPGNKTAVDDCDREVKSGAVQSEEDHRWISLPQSEQLNFICIRYE